MSITNCQFKRETTPWVRVTSILSLLDGLQTRRESDGGPPYQRSAADPAGRRAFLSFWPDSRSEQNDETSPRPALLILAVMAALGLSTRLYAGPNPVARPFKGSAQGYITAAIPPNGLFLEMSGQATHLGHFTREEFAFIGSGGSVSGTIVFTAANGDELWVSIDGAFTSGNDIEGLYTVTGGTGRFLGATGEATFQAFTPDFSYAEVTFNGTVSY
jgi:hypothetical protein